MAALTRRAVKLAAIGGAAVPIIGFTGRLSAATKAEERSNPIRACDIPIYSTNKPVEIVAGEAKEEPNIVQLQITKVRKWATGVYTDTLKNQAVKDVMSGYETVRDTARTGVEHSRVTLNYVQTNPGELPRVAFISIATMGGFIMGYRRSFMRKFLFATIASIYSASLCYPQFTKELTDALKADFLQLWRENIGWPLESPNKKGKQLKKLSMENDMTKQVKQMRGDYGQSRKEDKDLYSTRS